MPERSNRCALQESLLCISKVESLSNMINLPPCDCVGTQHQSLGCWQRYHCQISLSGRNGSHSASPPTTSHPIQLSTAQTMGWQEQAPDIYKRSCIIYLVVQSFLSVLEQDTKLHSLGCSHRPSHLPCSQTSWQVTYSRVLTSQELSQPLLRSLHFYLRPSAPQATGVPWWQEVCSPIANGRTISRLICSKNSLLAWLNMLKSSFISQAELLYLDGHNVPASTLRTMGMTKGE